MTYYFSQRDPRWSNVTIGQSRSTLGDFGCTLTALHAGLCYLLPEYYPHYASPATLAKRCRFTVDRLIWQSVEEVVPAVRFVFRHYGYGAAQRAALVAAASPSSPDTFAMLEYKGRHWGLALRAMWGYWLVMDPWTGKRAIWSGSTISGGAIFRRK